MKTFLLALQFLTSLPVKIKDVNNDAMARSLVYFPVVGLLLGFFLAASGKLLATLNLEPLVISVILTVLLVITTAGIHLDGVADTFDALLSGRRDKEEMLKIMRDSHIGAMGVVALICVLLLKASFLASVGDSLRTVSLVLMCVLSRWGQVLELYLFPYARGDGKAKVFSDGINRRIVMTSTAITLALVLIVWRLKGLSLAAGTILAVYLIGGLLKRKLGGITGDTIGMTSELLEIITLFGILIIG